MQLHADEVPVDADLVGRLVRAQFPEWAGVAITPVTSTGTDHAVFRLGEELAVRLPRIGWAVEQAAKERAWLPRLARSLPVELPLPVALGEPDLGYPWPWSVCRWLDGDDAQGSRVDPGELARFLVALRGVDPAGAPSTAGRRGGGLAPFDASTRAGIAALQDEIDADRALEIWEAALAAPPAPVRTWVHGDLLPGNLIVRAGHLTGVIDWGSSGLGDPACDLATAWSFDPQDRAGFGAALGADDDAWARARGTALSQAVAFIPYYERTIPGAVAATRRRLRSLLAG